MEHDLGTALHIVLEHGIVKRINEHNRLRRIFLYDYLLKMDYETALNGRRVPSSSAWIILFPLFLPFFARLLGHEGDADDNSGWPLADIPRTLACLRGLQKICRRHGVLEPSWEPSTHQNGQWNADGTHGLPQEALLDHLGLVKHEADSLHVADSFGWEDKWIGRVLLTPGMTARKMNRILLDAEEDNDPDSDSDDIAIPWDLDDRIA